MARGLAHQHERRGAGRADAGLRSGRGRHGLVSTVASRRLQRTAEGDSPSRLAWRRRPVAASAGAVPCDLVRSASEPCWRCWLACSCCVWLSASGRRGTHRLPVAPSGDWRALPNWALGDAVAALRRRRYRVVEASPLVQADRGPWGELFPLLAHTGALLVLSGLLVNEVWGGRSQGSTARRGTRAGFGHRALDRARSRQPAGATQPRHLGAGGRTRARTPHQRGADRRRGVAAAADARRRRR